jgi:hypothetical protein
VSESGCGDLYYSYKHKLHFFKTFLWNQCIDTKFHLFIHFFLCLKLPTLQPNLYIFFYLVPGQFMFQLRFQKDHALQNMFLLPFPYMQSLAWMLTLYLLVTSSSCFHDNPSKWGWVICFKCYKCNEKHYWPNLFISKAEILLIVEPDMVQNKCLSTVLLWLHKDNDDDNPNDDDDRNEYLYPYIFSPYLEIYHLSTSQSITNVFFQAEWISEYIRLESY